MAADYEGVAREGAVREVASLVVEVKVEKAVQTVAGSVVAQVARAAMAAGSVVA